MTNYSQRHQIIDNTVGMISRENNYLMDAEFQQHSIRDKSNFMKKEQRIKLGYERAIAVYKLSQSGNTSHEPESHISLSVQELQQNYQKKEKKAMTAGERKAAYKRMVTLFENQRALFNMKKDNLILKNQPKEQAKKIFGTLGDMKYKGLNPLQVYELKKKERQ